MKSLKEKYGKLIGVILCAVIIILSVADIWASSKKIGSFQLTSLPKFIVSLVLSVCLMIGVISDNKKMIKGNLIVFYAIFAFFYFSYMFSTPINQKSGTNLFDAINFTKNGWAYALHALFLVIIAFFLLIGLFTFIASHYFESNIADILNSCVLRTVAILGIVNIAWTIVAHILNVYSSNSNQVFELYNIAKDLYLVFGCVLIGTLKVEE